MTEHRPPGTGTPISFGASAPQQRNIAVAPPADAATADFIALQVARIATHFRTDLRQEQAKMLTQDFIEDLGRYRAADIEKGFAAYRRDPASKFFPKPGQIIDLIHAEIRGRSGGASVDKGRAVPAGPDGIAYPDGKSRPLMWWTLAKQLWKPDWRESEVPAGEFVRDKVGSAPRRAEHFKSC